MCREPFYEDPDPGPAFMWEWVYRDLQQRELVANECMAAGLPGDPEVSGPRPARDPELEEYGTPERLAPLERSRIAGGTGLYSPGDSSKIRWATEEPIAHDEGFIVHSLVQSRSLEEARGFLAAYGQETALVDSTQIGGLRGRSPSQKLGHRGYVSGPRSPTGISGPDSSSSTVALLSIPARANRWRSRCPPSTPIRIEMPKSDVSGFGGSPDGVLYLHTF
ncbi:hypothetical protein F5X98DRAFT_379957 [Xylaria grammica]|nr:hypothetical protein F5X98DRAFT_379957 [Xylaria grammica]